MNKENAPKKEPPLVEVAFNNLPVGSQTRGPNGWGIDQVKKPVSVHAKEIQPTKK